MENSNAYRPFPETLWTQVLRAKEGDEAARREALERLFQSYWRPLYSAIRYGWSRNHEEAKDLAQTFLADLWEREFWKDVDPALGRFRGFLKAALKNFMLNQNQARACLKRGGGKLSVPIEEIPEPAGGGSPEEILDREWIQTVLTEAMERLRRTYPTHSYYDVLFGYYVDPRGATYAELAERLGIAEAAVRYALAEGKEKLRLLIQESVRRYSSSQSDLEEEIRFILG